MGFAIIIETSLSVYGKTKQIQNLINILTKKDFENVMTAVGKKHMQAGFRAVRDAKTATRSEEQIRDARVCFRLAYEFFSEKRGGFLGFGGEPDYENMYQAALLIALCNWYFNDPKSTNQYLDFANNSFQHYYDAKYYDITYVPRFTSRSGIMVHSPWAQEHRDMAVQELKSEKTALESVNKRLRK